MSRHRSSLFLFVYGALFAVGSNTLPLPSSSSSSLAIYGLIPPNGQWDEPNLRRTLSAAASILPVLAGVTPAAADLHLIPITDHREINVANDDRIGVAARVAMLAQARRSFSDLRDTRAVSLYLAHAAAWRSIVDGDAPYALVLLDPASVIDPLLPVAAPASAAAAAAAASLPLVNNNNNNNNNQPFTSAAVAALWLATEAENREGGGGVSSPFHLAILSSRVQPVNALPPSLSSSTLSIKQPQQHKNNAAETEGLAVTALLDAGWRTPLAWRNWDAYVVTKKGAEILLSNGALPMTSRAESHAASLVALGLLRAIYLPSAALSVPRLQSPSPLTSTDGGEILEEEASLNSLFFETNCDLCTLPQDYSRTGRYARIALPALLVGYVTVLALRMLALGECGTMAASSSSQKRNVLPVTAKPSSDNICSM